MKHNFKQKKGFTLVELLVVIVIIGILFVVLVSRVDFSSNNARTSGVQTDMRSFQTAIRVVALKEQGLNDNVFELVESLNNNLDEHLALEVKDGVIQSTGTDPWGTEYRLEYTKPDNTLGQLVIVSAGADTEFGTKDDTRSVVRYEHTKSGGQVVVDDEVIPVESLVKKDIELVFKNNINTNELITVLEKCSSKSSSALMGGEFTTYILAEDATYRLLASYRALDGVAVLKYERGGTSYWYLNKKAAAHVGATEGWNVYNGTTYTPHTGSLSIKFASSTAVNFYSIDDMTLLFYGHLCSYEQEVISDDYLDYAGNCVKQSRYYYSCTCGEIGAATFDGGLNPDVHAGETYQRYVECDADVHGVVTYCYECDAEVARVNENHIEDGIGGCVLCPANLHVCVFDRTATNPQFVAVEATCTTPAKYYYSCGCGTAGTEMFESGRELGHIGGTLTCTQDRVCSRCGVTYEIAPGHSFTRKAKSTATLRTVATCETPATYWFACAHTHLGCSTVSTSDWWSDEGSATGHNYNQLNTDSKFHYSDATCVSPAKYYYSCSCGEKGTELFNYGEVDMTNHVGGTHEEYEEIDDTNHYRYEDCNSCDALLNTYTEPHQKDEQQNCTLCSRHVHSFTRKDNLYLHAAATCTTRAIYYFNCICNAKGTETYETGSELGHSMGEWYTTTPAACTSGGEKRKDCQRANCTYYETEQLNATGHNFTKQLATDTYLKSAATCTEPAHYYKSCQNCGLSSKDTAYEADFTYGASNGHRFNLESDNFLRTAATCEDHATYWFECADCHIQSPNDYYVKLDTALGHSLLETIQSANCEVNGIKMIECQRTGCTYSTSETLVAPGHNFDTDADGEDNWTTDAAPTCTANGSQSAVCQNAGCGYKKYEDIPALGHSIETIPEVAATCTEDGHQTQYHCTRDACDKYFTTAEATTTKEYSQTILTKLGHSYVNAICSREGCGLMAPAGVYTNGTCTSGYTWEQCVANGYVVLTEDGILTKLHTPSGYTQIVLPETVTQLGDPNATSNTFTSTTSQRSITSIVGAQNVTAINDYAFSSNSTNSSYRTKLVSIDTDETLTHVGKRAFYYCSSLTNIELSNVETIGDEAFSNCSALTTVDLSSLSSLGSSAFYFCTSLTSAENLGEIAIPTYAFYACNQLSTIDLSQVTSVGNNAFAACGKLPTTISLNNCSSIGEYAFGGYQNSVSNQSAVKVIENLGANLSDDEFVSIATNAFRYNQNIETIDLSKVNSLGTYSFYYASKLNAPNFGDHITTIPQYAFASAGKTATNRVLTIADQITTIDKHAFRESGYTSLSFENGSQISTIDDYAFYQLSSLNGTVTFPSTISYIGKSAFWNGSIDAVEFEGANNLTIGSSAFSYNYMSGSLNLPDGTISVQAEAFQYNSITSISIPASLTSIERNPWSNNRNLASITVDSNNPNYHIIQDSLVDKSSLNVICGTINSNLSTSSSNIDGVANNAFKGINFSNGNIPSNISYIGSSAFYDASLGSSLSIPSSVTSIGSEAFCENGSFSYISSSSYSYPEVNGCLMSGNTVLYGEPSATIPSTATSISCHAFYNGGSYTIPSSVTSIGQYAFYNCDTITFDNVNNITSIGSVAFYGIDNTSFTFPENSSFKSINDGVLRGSSVTTVYIPTNVTSIYSGYSSCNPLGNATSIIYSGTLSQWLSISKTPSYISGGSYTVTCSNGSITKGGTVSMDYPLHEIFDLISVSDSEISTIESSDGTYTKSSKSFSTTLSLGDFTSNYGDLMSNFNSISSTGQFSISISGTIDVSSGGTSSSDFASIYTSLGSPTFTKLITSDLTMEKDTSTGYVKWKISSSSLTAETALSKANSYVTSPPIKQLVGTDVTIDYYSSSYKYTCNGNADSILAKYASTYPVYSLTSDDLTIGYYSSSQKTYTYTGTAAEFATKYGTTYGTPYTVTASDLTMSCTGNYANNRFTINYSGNATTFFNTVYSAIGSPGINKLTTSDLAMNYSSGTTGTITYTASSDTLTSNFYQTIRDALSYTIAISGLVNQDVLDMLNNENLKTISVVPTNNVSYANKDSWDFTSIEGAIGVKICIVGEMETNFDWVSLAANRTTASNSSGKFITTGGTVTTTTPSSTYFTGVRDEVLVVRDTAALKGCVLLKTDGSVLKSGYTIYIIPIFE